MSYAQASRRSERQQHVHYDRSAVEAAQPVRRAEGASQGVHLEGVAMLKIIKHCRDNFPVTVAGALLGMESGETGVVEVTNCFPQPANAEGDRDHEEPYEKRMMKNMKEVGTDNNHVGWYTSTYLGSYFLKDTIEHQADFQALLPNYVMLVYDNVPTASGNLSMKAVRLTKEFMDQWTARGAGRLSQEAFAKLVPSAVFEELPVRIHNPHLVNAFILDVADSRALGRASASAPGALSSLVGGDRSGPTRMSGVSALGGSAARGDLDTDMARLDLNTAPYLEKHLEFLNDMVDSLLKASNDASYHARRQAQAARQREEWIARRRAENESRAGAGLDPLPEEDMSLPFFRQLPDRGSKGSDPLDGLLISAQIGTYCDQVNKFAGAAAGKLFLAGQLQKTQ